jgi:Flp pilus assembly protein TadG
LRLLGRDRHGGAMIEFGVIAGILALVSVAIVDLSLLVFDYARATEATRRATRIAAIAPPIATLDNLLTVDIVCSAPTGTVACNGAAPVEPATFDSIVTAMQAVLTTVGRENVEVAYRASGIGTAEAGGYKPYVTVRLLNLQRPLIFLDTLTGGSGAITFPPFTTTLIGNSYIPTV